MWCVVIGVVSMWLLVCVKGMVFVLSGLVSVKRCVSVFGIVIIWFDSGWICCCF